MFFFRPTSSVFIVSVAELTHWVFKLCITLCLFFFILLSVWVHIHHTLPVGSLCAVGLGQMLIYSWPELSVCQQRLTQQWYSSFTPSLLLLFGLHCVPLAWALVFVNTPAHVIDVRLSDFPILADQCVYLLTLHHIQPDISTASVIRQQHDVTLPVVQWGASGADLAQPIAREPWWGPEPAADSERQFGGRASLTHGASVWCLEFGRLEKRLKIRPDCDSAPQNMFRRFNKRSQIWSQCRGVRQESSRWRVVRCVFIRLSAAVRAPRLQ